MGSKREFDYCVRLPRLSYLPTNSYARVEEKVIGRVAYSKDQAVARVLFEEVGKDAIGVVMHYLQNKKGDANGHLQEFVLDFKDLDDLEARVAVSKIKGSLMDVEILPDVKMDELTLAASKKLGGKESDYHNFVEKYFFKRDNR
ncbi:hypothetical protein KAS08_01030 [Candidatus Pacearchaeota archaeon]|nr:hypothetical protein [Candidatus Pacearchaeota archaeon]